MKTIKYLSASAIVIIAFAAYTPVQASVTVGSEDGRPVMDIDIAPTEANSFDDFELSANIGEAVGLGPGKYLTSVQARARGNSALTGDTEQVSCMVHDLGPARSSSEQDFKSMLEQFGHQSSHYKVVQGDVIGTINGVEVHDCHVIDTVAVANVYPVLSEPVLAQLGLSSSGNRVHFVQRTVSSLSLDTDPTNQLIKVFSVNLTDGGIFNCKLVAQGQFETYFVNTGFTQPKSGAFYTLKKKANGWCQQSAVSMKATYLSP